MKPKRDYAKEITDQVLSILERGERPWTFGWDRSGVGALPTRFTGEAYRGVNLVSLWAASMIHGYTSNRWLTYRQCQELGAQVKKGSKGQPICYYNTVDSKTKVDANGDPEKIRFLRFYIGFNADCIEGLPEAFYCKQERGEAPPSNSDVEAFIARLGSDVRYGGAGAFYASGRSDYIQMPDRERFTDSATLYATLFHEHIHWTETPARCNRDTSDYSKNVEARALEELVAELGSAMLCSIFQLSTMEHVEDHASYIGHWISHLQRDPQYLFKAAADAQKAVDFLLARGAVPLANAA